MTAVICLHFSVFVRIARRRRFTGIDVWLLCSFCATIIPTPLFAFGCCFLLPAEVPVPKLKFTTRIAVRGLQSLLKNWYDISSSKPVNSNEIAESSSQSEQSLQIKPFPLFAKSISAMKRTSTLDAITSWQRWIKVSGLLGNASIARLIIILYRISFLETFS